MAVFKSGLTRYWLELLLGAGVLAGSYVYRLVSVGDAALIP